jgi:hypothetical protein
MVSTQQINNAPVRAAKNCAQYHDLMGLFSHLAGVALSKELKID